MTGDNHAQIRILLKQVEQRLPEPDALLLEFVKLWWSRIPEEDLLPRKADDDAGASIDTWRMFEVRDPNETDIHISNPEHAQEGWQSRYTVVRVLTPDMPFVTDSLLMALSHDGLITHHLSNVVFATTRDENQRITSLKVSSGKQPKEVLIYAEIDRIHEDAFAELRTRLHETMVDVTAAVSDFEAMKEKLTSLRNALGEKPPATVAPEEVQESVDFLDWISDRMFTFLGYRSFDYADGMIRQTEDSALGVMRNRRVSTPRRIADQETAVQEFLLRQQVLSFSQSGTKSRVHRPAYPDYFGIRKFDDQGKVVGEHGFLGLYTARVYREEPDRIPIVRSKVSRVMARSGLTPDGFDGKVMRQVLATFPKDELLQTPEDELLRTAKGITYIHERRRTRLFVRRDPYGLFVHCLVYLPREHFNTQVRIRLVELLESAFEAEDSEFEPFFSESILVRLQINLRVRPGKQKVVDEKLLEEKLLTTTRDWSTDFLDALSETFGESLSRRFARDYALAFPAGYRENYSVRTAVSDIEIIERLSAEKPLLTHFYRRPEESAETLHLKLYRMGSTMPLSDVIATLENLGLRVCSEHPYYVDRSQREPVSILDFDLLFPERLDLREISERFADAFVRIWEGKVDDDRYNRLILAAGLTWRQTNVLRTYARYLKQIRFGFSQQFISDTLFKHAGIAATLVRYFEDRFDPEGTGERAHDLQAEIISALDEVALLNEDRILRRYLDLINATKRVNYYRRDEAGEPRDFLSLKLVPSEIRGVPRPVPAFEIFVSSPTMEGVHLRGGAIARGGLRWSDRAEDYRTEVLGLVKAQAVKNAVIVPTGAKGGFIIRHPSEDADAFRVQGVACYRDFIRGLLDLTDNVNEGAIQYPPSVRRHDGDDPYLVVAADKGTATFSDTANAVAADYRFWLGDAFASGGSNGYDHKAMGITARGAWVSVQRHFAERGIDVQQDPVSVLGIGDMSGDVFGNGMLLSRSIQLVAAFNHLHIFIDPEPDPEKSFQERQRLFQLPRSSWTDYAAELISVGGGVFPRSAKSIELTPEICSRFGISAQALSPDELIHELLKSPVDLIWNGGIGTYVKASSETHEDVGDRANDGLRVDAGDLRCQVIGEGGNLGITQHGRVEFSQNGGSVNSDFIDNSAGVDCSDHEVNIKIALNTLVAEGELTEKHRNQMLESMTDQVAELVLTNNFRQAQVLSLAELQVAAHDTEFQRFITLMENAEGLDRSLEGLPSDELLTERTSLQQTLTRPELAVLLAFSKTHVKNALNRTVISSDPFIRREVYRPFPDTLVQRYPQTLEQHRLTREIVGTQLANDVVHHMGITFVSHLMEMVGASVEEILRAYMAAAACFRVREQYRQIETLPGIDARTRLRALSELVRLGRRSTRWLLRHERSNLDVAALTARFQTPIDNLADHGEALLGELAWAQRQARRQDLINSGVPEVAATQLAASADTATALTVVTAAESCDTEPQHLVCVYADVGQRLNLSWLTARLSQLSSSSHWQIMERDSLIDDMVTEQGRLAALVQRQCAGNVDQWLLERPPLVTAWNAAIDAAQHANTQDFSLFAITCRKLIDLGRAA